MTPAERRDALAAWLRSQFATGNSRSAVDTLVAACGNRLDDVLDRHDARDEIADLTSERNALLVQAAAIGEQIDQLNKPLTARRSTRMIAVQPDDRETVYLLELTADKGAVVLPINDAKAQDSFRNGPLPFYQVPVSVWQSDWGQT